MSSQLESIYSDELILLAETLGEVKTRTEKLEGEFSTHAKPLEAATNALSAALSGIKALQFHVLDNNLGALSARVEEMRKAVDEQVGVIALELKKADETNAAKAGADAEALRSEIVALQSQLGSLVTQFGQQLERVEFAAKEEAKKLQLIPGPAGAAGASLNPRGTFIDGEVYNRLDVVSWLGSSYIATVDGVTEKPSKNSNQWQTLASRGGGGAGGVGDFGSLAGVAQINQGGTGQTTRAAGLNALLPDQAGSTQYMLLTDGSGTVSWGAQPVAGLPSQTSNSGRLLTTNGSTASWSNAVTVSGSNATVGGTLTVNGASIATAGQISSTATSALLAAQVYIANGASSGTNGALSGSQFLAQPGYSLFVGTTGNGTAASYQGGVLSGVVQDQQNYVIGDGARGLLLHAVNGLLRFATGNTGVQRGYFDASGLKIETTTASTSTSSGALVVGNGTSGGLGVGGDANIGGVLRCTNGTIVASGGTPPSTGYGVELQHNGTNGYVYSYNRNTTSANPLYLNHTGGNLFLGNITSVANIVGTTASTSTSSGALVVSGGLGVGGAIYAGGALNVLRSGGDNQAVFGDGSRDTNIQMKSTGNVSGNVLTFDSGVRLTVGATTPFGAYVTLYNGVGINTTTPSVALDVVGAIKCTTNITTGAPTGGTAASWKLGTVASVSPTSPNRTIEVDIGGTIYYIHAKTTNN
jgi:hypothetical protein